MICYDQACLRLLSYWLMCNKTSWAIVYQSLRAWRFSGLVKRINGRGLYMHFVNVHNEYAEAGKQIQYTINYCHTVRTLLCFGNSAFLLTLLSGIILMLWITCAGLRHQYPYYRYRYHHTLVLYNNVFVINYSANHCASTTLISKPVGCSRPLLLMQYVIIKKYHKTNKRQTRCVPTRINSRCTQRYCIIMNYKCWQKERSLKNEIPYAT